MAKFLTGGGIDDEAEFYPLCLKWVAEKQCWKAGTRMLTTARWVDLGNFNTVAAADAAYRAAVGLCAGRVSEVFVNANRYCRMIVDGQIVPLRPQGRAWITGGKKQVRPPRARRILRVTSAAYALTVGCSRTIRWRAR